MKRWYDLSGRVAVVIGGTSGLGLSIAYGLAEHGADVVASGRSREKVEDTAGMLELSGRSTLRVTVDVDDRASIDALRDAVSARFGRADILVNAAGARSARRRPRRRRPTGPG